MAQGKDLFEGLLSLEDQFYEEGFKLGLKDGNRAGLIDGRLFGLEKGFEKYSAMGKLHGRAMIWAGRLPNGTKDDLSAMARRDLTMKHLNNSRLNASVRTLYALTEPDSLSTENAEGPVSDFDDRLKRAEGKLKAIEKLTGETCRDDRNDRASRGGQMRGDGGIEDTSVLNMRR